MNKSWWLLNDSTIRFISTVLWFILKLIGVLYVIYRLESIAEAVGADESDDEETPE